MSEPGLYHVLFYDYVRNVLERRAHPRAAHLAFLRDWQEDGRVVMAGAVGDPPQFGMLVFRVGEPGEVERFAQADPYVEAGVVTSWRVEPWNVV